MTFFKDLAASFQIFASNFTDRFGLWVNGLLLFLVFAGVLFFILRASAVSLRARRLDTRLQMPPRDKEREARLAQRLSQAVQIPTIAGNERALDRFHRWMEREFPLVFAAMRPLYLPGGCCCNGSARTQARKSRFCSAPIWTWRLQKGKSGPRSLLAARFKTAISGGEARWIARAC